MEVLTEQYGAPQREAGEITLEVDGTPVSVICSEEQKGHVEVSCSNAALKERIDASMEHAGLVLQAAEMPSLQPKPTMPSLESGESAPESSTISGFVKAEVLAPEVKADVDTADVPDVVPDMAVEAAGMAGRSPHA